MSYRQNLEAMRIVADLAATDPWVESEDEEGSAGEACAHCGVWWTYSGRIGTTTHKTDCAWRRSVELVKGTPWEYAETKGSG